MGLHLFHSLLFWDYSSGVSIAFIDWKYIPDLRGAWLPIHHGLQSIPSFSLCSNLLHLSVTNHLKSFIHHWVDTGGGSIQLFYLQTIYPKVVVNSCGVIMRRFHLLTPFFVLSGLEDCSKRPKRVLGVDSNRFLPTCWHILSHVSSGLSLFIVVPYDANSFARCVYTLFELMYVHTSVPFRGI